MGNISHEWLKFEWKPTWLVIVTETMQIYNPQTNIRRNEKIMLG